ncbi:hypothetical protein niasHT_012802 [Heterodera trifolii]|uniref:G-protein coupled receptors family 1 profile domain-containing protein n=1 Tax=Heterodera trifolii TaxID=157864 RepID=A0ABD2L918_9BILA
MDSSTTATDLQTVLNSSVLQLPDYLPYLELCLNWIALISHGITSLTMGFLVLLLHCLPQLLRIQNLAPTLLLFLYAHFGFSILSTPYQIYRVSQWRTPGTYTQNNFSPYTLYWLSMPELVYYGTIPSPVFLLAIERCVCAKWPLSTVKRHFSLIMAVTFAIVLVVNTAGHLFELPLDIDAVYFCETASCTTTTYRLYVHLVTKIVFSCANVACSLALLFMLRAIDNAAKFKNRVIIFTVIVELIFGVFPCFVSIVYNQVLNLPIGAPNSGLKGEIASTCCAFDGAMCGILYVSVLLKRSYRSSTVANVLTTVEGATKKVQQKAHENLPKVS